MKATASTTTAYRVCDMSFLTFRRGFRYRPLSATLRKLTATLPIVLVEMQKALDSSVLYGSHNTASTTTVYHSEMQNNYPGASRCGKKNRLVHLLQRNWPVCPVPGLFRVASLIPCAWNHTGQLNRLLHVEPIVVQLWCNSSVLTPLRTEVYRRH